VASNKQQIIWKEVKETTEKVGNWKKVAGALRRVQGVTEVPGPDFLGGVLLFLLEREQ